MHNELTNLLPPARQNALAREYSLRLGVVALWFVSVITFVAMILLIPTYVLLTGSARSKEARLASVQMALSSTSETTLPARLAALSSNAATLSALAHAPAVSATLRSILAVSRPGVTLSGFSYTPAAADAAGSLAISGVAATRDALRLYQIGLSGIPIAKTVNVPVSAYAKDRDIAFTITITLAP